jgi:hypothetical protein
MAYYWVWKLGSLEDSINVLEGFWKGYGTYSLVVNRLRLLARPFSDGVG